MGCYEMLWMVIDTPLQMLVGGGLALGGVVMGAKLWGPGASEDLDEY
tara:strand:+ start:76 stop:216 length:141 start_codon:yes stop_codon:yes gene_type:complete